MIWLIIALAAAVLIVAAPAIFIGALAERVCRRRQDKR